jgi:AraC-like DNA-binding protein
MNLSRRYVSRLLSERGDLPQRRIRRERTLIAERLLSGRFPVIAASLEEAARLSGFSSPRALRDALRETEAGDEQAVETSH